MPRTPVASDVHAAICDLLRFYELGVNDRSAHPTRYGHAGSDAKAAGTNEETLRKARSFAARYTPEERDALFQQMRELQAVLTTGRVIRLLTVTDKRKRASLQRKVLENHWNRAELDAAIRAQCGNRRVAAGRMPGIPRNVAGIRFKSMRLSEEWQRFHETVMQLEALAERKLTKAECMALAKVHRAMAKLITLLAEKFPKQHR